MHANPSEYSLLQQHAKQHRRFSTVAESFLWEHLRGKRLGVKFRRQHVLYGMIPDFVCLCLQIIVEVDGGYHHTDYQQAQDSERTAFLESKGYFVLRFTNEEVMADSEGVLQQIRNVIVDRQAQKDRYMSQL